MENLGITTPPLIVPFRRMRFWLFVSILTCFHQLNGQVQLFKDNFPGINDGITEMKRMGDRMVCVGKASQNSDCALFVFDDENTNPMVIDMFEPDKGFWIYELQTSNDQAVFRSYLGNWYVMDFSSGVLTCFFGEESTGGLAINHISTIRIHQVTGDIYFMGSSDPVQNNPNPYQYGIWKLDRQTHELTQVLDLLPLVSGGLLAGNIQQFEMNDDHIIFFNVYNRNDPGNVQDYSDGLMSLNINTGELVNIQGANLPYFTLQYGRCGMGRVGNYIYLNDGLHVLRTDGTNGSLSEIAPENLFRGFTAHGGGYPIVDSMIVCQADWNGATALCYFSNHDDELHLLSPVLENSSIYRVDFAKMNDDLYGLLVYSDGSSELRKFDLQGNSQIVFGTDYFFDSHLPFGLIAGQSHLFFEAYTNTSHEIWYTDGTEWGTGLASSGNITFETPHFQKTYIGNSLYFQASSTQFGEELFRLDERNLTVPIHHFPEVSVYPNPVTDRMTIEWPANETVSEISIYDITGRFFGAITIQGDRNQQSIDLSFLSQGVYILDILGSQPKTEKIIKK